MSQAGPLNASGGGNSGENIQNIIVQSGTSPIVATSNTIIFDGTTVAAGTNPVETVGLGPNTMALAVQTSQAIASSNASNIGLSAFNSSDFTVDANGFVSLSGGGGGGITTIHGDTGSITGSSVTIYALTADQNCGTVSFVNSGTISTLNLSDGLYNTILGLGGGNSSNFLTGAQNTGVGGDCLSSLLGGIGNCAFGTGTLGQLLTGNSNIVVGNFAGNNYTSGESSNICIGSAGVTGESGIIRIGDSSYSNETFIAGVAGVTVSNTNMVTIDTTTGQLGSQAISSGSISITGDTGGALSSSSFTFTGGTTGLKFSGSGTTETLTGTLILANGGTNASLVASNGGIFYSTASAGAILAGTATARQMLQSGASTNPAWSTTTWPATSTINQILYSSSANTVTGLATANNGVLITSATGVPSILPNGVTGQFFAATTGSPPSWASPPASSISITGDTGGALTGNAFTFTGGTTGLTFSGSGSTETLTGTLIVANGGTGRATLTNHGVLVGAGTSAITQLATGSAGQVLQSGGASADPAYSTATYPSTATGTGTILRADGTNWVATTSTYPNTNAINTLLYASSANVMSALATANNGVLITSATGVPSWLPNGTTGQVLTATTGSPPSWTTGAAGGITTIDGDSGSITGATVTIYANNSGNNCGSSVSFENSGTISTLNLTDANNNTIIGNTSGNLSISGANNSSFGANSLTALTSGVNNVSLGATVLISLQGGSGNIGIGVATLGSLVSGSSNIAIGGSSLHVATGSSNIAVGSSALVNLTSGTPNIAIGNTAGGNYSSSESSNIIIGNTGTAAESHVIRIGTQGTGSGQQSTCYVAGIAGVTVSNINMVTINTTTGQLGSQALPSSSITITGNSGGALTGSSFTFTGGTTGLTFSGSGTTETLTGILVGANGGTGANNTTTTTGTILISNGTAFVPTTATYPSTTTANQLLYSSAANVVGGVTAGNYGVLISSSSGVPSWLTNGTTGQVLTATTSGNPSWSSTPANVFYKVIRQVFTSTGTYTPTSGMLYCDIEVVGGGGGGGGVATNSATQASGAGGGGGGGYARGIFTASSIGVSQAVTIGAAGTAGPATVSTTGGTGGTTSVGSLISATGGAGGQSGNSYAFIAVSGGAGGSGSNGDFQTKGSPGGPGLGTFSGFGAAISGSGGSSFFGGGGLGIGLINSSSPGNAATSYGGGGSGGNLSGNFTGVIGGVGFKGVVIITEYI